MSNVEIINPDTNKPFASSYDGHDRFGPELAQWAPMLTAADDDVLQGWERSVGRMRDLIQENGITSGAVQTHLDNIVGPGLKLVPKPDWQSLGLSREWADEFQAQVESAWHEFASDPERRCHAAESLDVTGMIQQGFRSYLTTGEITSVVDWIERPDFVYRTAIQPIDPERISNPAGVSDRVSLRAGVEKNDRGAPVAYHVRESHPNAAIGLTGSQSFRWKRIPRQTEFGRRMFIHIFDQQRPGQTRGQTGMLAGIKQVKMMERWQQTSLQAAIINSMYAAVIESSMDHPGVMEALSGNGDDAITKYISDALEFHQGTGKIKWDGSRIAHLFPGEKLNMLKAEQPVAAFEQFESASLRNLAASWNMSYEQLSRDYTKTNFSSARASMLEAWKFIVGQRQKIAGRYANEVYALFLEDAIDSGRIVLPRRAPAFLNRKAAYTRAEWIGPGREQIDPKKSAEATAIDLKENVTTLESECAKRGLDWREVVEQRGRETQALRDAGLEPSDVAAALAGQPRAPDDPDQE